MEKNRRNKEGPYPSDEQNGLKYPYKKPTDK
jgi:hypothetical protein